MMRRIGIIIAFCLVTGMVSCHREEIPHKDGPVTSGTDGLSFSAFYQTPEGWNPITKAVDVDLSYLKSNGFGVYGYYTEGDNYTESSVKGVVLNNRKVSWGTDYKYNTSNGSWTNTGNNAWIYYGQNYYGTNQPGYKEYWPMKDGEKMTFFAYAPYNLWKDVVNPSGASCTGQIPQIPYQLYKSGDSGVSMSGTSATVGVSSGIFANGIQRDLLWGVQSTGYAFKNFTRPEEDTEEAKENTVKFIFRHALSKIGFNILTEDVPTVSDATLTSFDTRAVTQTSGSYTGQYTTDRAPKTVYLLESVSISSSDGLLVNTGTLSLDNITAADQPEWSSIAGSVAYNFGSSIIGTDILYVKNSNNTPANESNNKTNYSTLISRRTSVTGMNATAASLMGSSSNYFYALPSSGNITVTVKYHRITFYYHYGNNNSSRYWTVYDGADNIGTVTKTFPANFEAGRRYDFNILLKGEEMELELQVKPWELDSFSYEYSDDDYSVIEYLTFDSDYMDYRIDDKVYINNRVGKFTFRVDGGRYLYWRASLIPNSAFAFTDKYGNYLTDTGGDLISMQSGALGRDIYNEVYVKALNTSSTTMNSARLRFYFYDGEGHAVVPLDLINMETSGGKKILEWTVVQNAN